MKKMLTLFLALVMVISLIPMNAMAIKMPAVTKPIEEGKKDTTTQDTQKPEDLLKPEGEPKLTIKAPVYYHPTGEHEYGYASNTKYHWLQCPCGCQISMEPHVDPKNATNDTCTCGYRFSDNADLVTLWVDGCPPIKKFNKNTTEYKLNAYTYKDVKEIKISTRTYDSEATVELPEDLTLKAGENKFDVKVIAENQKATKTYTLIITK